MSHLVELSADAQQLELLLRQALEPATVHSADRALRKALKPAAAALPLAERAAGSAAPEVRQLAAVLLRRRIVGHYGEMPVEARAQLKALLLARLGVEPDASPRRALAAVASALGAVLLPTEGWPELLQFVSSATQAPTAEHREVAMLVLAELFETPSAAAIFRPHLTATVQVLLSGLADPHAPQVRTASLRAVGAFATSLLDGGDEPSTSALRTLLPAALEVARTCVAAAVGGGDAARALGVNDDELHKTLGAAFEMLMEVVESAPSALVKANIGAIAQVSLELAHGAGADADVRAHGFHALTALAAYKCKLVAKNGELLEHLVGLGAKATGEWDEADDDDDDESDESNVRSLGCALLDTLGAAISSAPLMGHVDTALQRLTAEGADAHTWCAACTVLGMVAEGIVDLLAEKKTGAPRLAAYVQLLCRGCLHADAHVRAAAALGLGEFARHIPSKLLVRPHAASVIGHLAAVIDASAPHVGLGGGAAAEGAGLHVRALDKVCYALDALCESAAGADETDAIVPHAPELLSRLGTLCAAPRVPAAARAAAVSALSALVGCGQRAVPAASLAAVIHTMAQVLETVDGAAPGAGGLRARATECVGLCALALGADSFRPLAANACAAAVAGLGSIGKDGKDSEVAEYTYGFAAHMAALYKEQLDAQFVHALLPHALAACAADEVVEQGGDGEGGGDGGDEEGDVQYGLHSGVLDEKSSAVHTVGRLCKHCAPQLGAAGALACVRALAGGQPPTAATATDDDDDEEVAPLDHYMSSLRVAALYNCAYACAAALRTAAASGDAQAQQAAEALVRGVAMAKMLAALNDEDADVVAAAAVALARLGRLCGAALFDDASAPLNSIGNTLRALLAHEAPCQVGLLADGGLAELLRARGLPAIGGPPGGGGMGGDDDEDEGGDPDAAAVDEAAWEAVAALMTGLARSLGDTWAVAFDALLPALLARAGADMPHGEQATAIGVVAETLERLGERHAARHTQALLPVALRLAATPLKPRAPDDDDDDDDAAQVVQNAVYCAGVLAAPGGPAVLGAMQQLLSALRPLLERGRVADRLSDNALGAVARVLRGSAAHLPLGEIVPVMLAALPIREDYRENEVTLRTLMVLFSDAGTQQILGGHRPGFLQLLASVVVQHDAAVVERLATQGVSDDDEAEDQEEQDDHLTPTMRAELAAFLAASGVAI